MPKAQPTKEGRARAARKAPSAAAPSREVTAKDVIGNLLNLFEHLGIDIARPVTEGSGQSRVGKSSHTLYPFASAIGELLTSWHQEPEYINEQGNPARLRLHGPRPSFHSLAQQTVPDVDESYLLSELERLGALTIEDNDYAQVHMRSFPVYEDKRLAAQHTLTTLDGFITTLRHNLDSTPSNSDQLFHRIAWNNDFDAQELPALKIRVKRHGQTFLESFDDWLMRKTLSRARKSNRNVKAAQVSIGVYLTVDKERPTVKR
jgi:hypothetical protein